MTETPDAPGGSTASGPRPADLPELPGVNHPFVPLRTGLRTHVAQAGNPDDPPVLLLHGFPQHWWEWRKVIPPLAERYRADDLAGHLVDGAGHFLADDRPDAVVTHALELFGRIL